MGVDRISLSHFSLSFLSLISLSLNSHSHVSLSLTFLSLSLPLPPSHSLSPSLLPFCTSSTLPTSLLCRVHRCKFRRHCNCRRSFNKTLLPSKSNFHLKDASSAVNAVLRSRLFTSSDKVGINKDIKKNLTWINAVFAFQFCLWDGERNRDICGVTSERVRDNRKHHSSHRRFPDH